MVNSQELIGITEKLTL